MTRQERIQNAITPFVPSGTSKRLSVLIHQYKCQLTITRERKTKAGDYRHPYGKAGHRISVNGTLNQYAFLITFIHELAHLLNWERNRNKVQPHGPEWKRAFQELMTEFLTEQVFPKEILKPLTKHMRNPKSATVRDLDLVRALKKFDQESERQLLEELPIGAEFVLNNRSFRKGEKLRKRYRCEQLGTGKIYLVSAIAEVLPAAP